MQFKSKGTVICIGDANHAMAPTAGNGANMALMDGKELAEQMISCKDLKTALIEYDKQAMPRSAKSIKVSRIAVFVISSKRLINYALMSIAKLPVGGSESNQSLHKHQRRNRVKCS